MTEWMGNYHILDDRLTLDKWNDLVHARHIEECKNRFITDTRISSSKYEQWERQFDKLQKSSLLIRNFLQYPQNMQNTIQDSIEYGSPVQDIETFVNLMMKLKGTKYEDLIKLNHQDLYVRLQRITYASVHYDFGNQVGLFRKWHSDDPFISRSTIHLLGILYGVDSVLNIMDEWIANKTIRPTSDFAKLAENWSELKDYPLDWALGVISSH